MKRALSFAFLVSLSLVNCTNAMLRSFRYSPGNNNGSFTHFNKEFSNRNLSFGIETYFQNLYVNCPANLGSSCGFVSLAMYLSYYDSFRNDAMIPLAYERTSIGNSQESVLAVSPGVQRLAKPEEQSVQSFVNSNKNTDYQCHLIDIYNNEINDNDYIDSIGMWNYQIILDVLFGTNNVVFTTFSWCDYGATYTSEIVQSSLKTIAQNKILQGEPVVIHYHVGDNYHSVVAYAYDEDGIHAHFGWGSDSTDLIIGDDEYISEVGYANMSYFTNRHSKNYVINGLKYCGCGQHVFHTLSYCPLGLNLDYQGLESELFDEQDNSDGELSFLDNYHEASCACGYSTVELHFHYYGYPIGVCSGCGVDASILVERFEEDEN